jgi:mono/diheme cytochrome c family protein
MLTLKNLLILFLFFIAFVMLFPSCYYDKEETLYPFQKCDTAHVTYSQTIVPIFSANCIVCHTSNNPGGNVALDSYAGSQVVAANGKLIPAIDHTGPFPMPKGGSILDQCSIDMIKKWVAGGALDN